MRKKRKMSEAERMEKLIKRIWSFTKGDPFQTLEIIKYADIELFPQFMGMDRTSKAKVLGRELSKIVGQEYAGYKLFRRGEKRPSTFKLRDVRRKSAPKSPKASKTPVRSLALDNSYSRAARFCLMEVGFDREKAREMADRILKLAAALDDIV